MRDAALASDQEQNYLKDPLHGKGFDTSIVSAAPECIGEHCNPLSNQLLIDHFVQWPMETRWSHASIR